MFIAEAHATLFNLQVAMWNGFLNVIVGSDCKWVVSHIAAPISSLSVLEFFVDDFFSAHNGFIQMDFLRFLVIGTWGLMPWLVELSTILLETMYWNHLNFLVPLLDRDDYSS